MSDRSVDYQSSLSRNPSDDCQSERWSLFIKHRCIGSSEIINENEFLAVDIDRLWFDGRLQQNTIQLPPIQKNGTNEWF